MRIEVCWPCGGRNTGIEMINHLYTDVSMAKKKKKNTKKTKKNICKLNSTACVDSCLKCVDAYIYIYIYNYTHSIYKFHSKKIKHEYKYCNLFLTTFLQYKQPFCNTFIAAFI